MIHAKSNLESLMSSWQNLPIILHQDLNLHLIHSQIRQTNKSPYPEGKGSIAPTKQKQLFIRSRYHLLPAQQTPTAADHQCRAGSLSQDRSISEENEFEYNRLWIPLFELVGSKLEMSTALLVLKDDGSILQQLSTGIVDVFCSEVEEDTMSLLEPRLFKRGYRSGNRKAYYFLFLKKKIQILFQSGNLMMNIFARVMS
ncbi:hypothetical protein CEXT_321431 [Caerostris extrusa]|uniref:Uncharacterized protein n=1 Tax=Caerostris extrusa TaxID=172846 RepID=A0AAV4S4F2_CAEEX|nr:hypothetical protein CEXT_321431 [Caerostris extrusa]